METGAVAGVTMQTMDGGDTASLPVTLDEAERRVAVGAEPKDMVADKGYHSNATTTGMKDRGLRSYVGEPDRGRRKWKGKKTLRKRSTATGAGFGATGASGSCASVARSWSGRSRTSSLRAGCAESTFAGQETIQENGCSFHTAAPNLGLLMRKRFGLGTPRGLQGLAAAAEALADASARGIAAIPRQVQRIRPLDATVRRSPAFRPPIAPGNHNSAILVSCPDHSHSDQFCHGLLTVVGNRLATRATHAPPNRLLLTPPTRAPRSRPSPSEMAVRTTRGVDLSEHPFRAQAERPVPSATPRPAQAR